MKVSSFAAADNSHGDVLCLQNECGGSGSSSQHQTTQSAVPQQHRFCEAPLGDSGWVVTFGKALLTLDNKRLWRQQCRKGNCRYGTLLMFLPNSIQNRKWYSLDNNSGFSFRFLPALPHLFMGMKISRGAWL